MLKPICHSGSIKVPEYLETDKEKNAGRTPLSSDIQQVRNVVEDVPPFPESRTARGSVSAAYRLSFDKCFAVSAMKSVKRCMVAFLENKYLRIFIPGVSATLT